MASNEDLFSAPQTAGPDAGEGAAAEAPAPAKRPRRATKKASAPAPAESAEPAAADAGGAGDTPADTPAAEPPARKKAAKRAPRKKASAAAPTEETHEAPVEASAATPVDAPSEVSADDTPAPAKKTAKKTARKSTKKAAKAAPAADTDATDATEGSVHDAPAAAPASSAPEADEAEVAEAAPAAPAAPGVLFQAPDPEAAAPKRRRATKKASAPAPAEPAEAAIEEARDDRSRDDKAHGDQRGDSRDEAATDDSAGEETSSSSRRRRRRGGKGRGRGRGDDAEASETTEADAAEDQSDEDSDGDSGAEGEGSSSRRRRRRRRSGSAAEGDDPPGTVTKVRESRRDEPQSVKGSTRLEAKKQRRREGREAGRRRTIITEAEFLARRESVERVMVVREREGKTQIGVLEDDVLVEHYVSRETNASMAGNVYLGRVQNVLPSMEAAFVDIGKGRNAVLYAGEVNWDAAGLQNNQPKRIENALKSGDTVLVQVTKDPIGHKGARLTSQISLPGRYLVYVPEGSMTGISRKLPDTERARLKSILKEVVPDSAGVIVRTAAEGASEEELRADVERLTKTWDKIQQKAQAKGKAKGGAPALVHGEPDLTVRVIRDVFNEDFSKLVVAGEQAWSEVSDYLGDVAPDLAQRLEKWTGTEDLFTRYRVDEQIAKAMDRKVWLPSGGSLVIDRTEAMTVVDVNTGKFVGSGGNLEETVTKNNIEAAEEIVRQLRLRDIGGIIVIDFIDMVLESNRDLVVRRLLECLGRDRTKHQVAEVTSLGLVQMTRKRVGSGLIEVFSETCDHCGGRGIIVHDHPVEKSSGGGESGGGSGSGSPRNARGRGRGKSPAPVEAPVHHGGPTPAQIAAAAHAAALKSSEHLDADEHEVLAAHDEHDEHPADEATSREPAPEHPAAAEPTPDLLAETAPEVPAEPVSEPGPKSSPESSRESSPAPVATQPAAPRRRKRGRVVAPAGPPRGATTELNDGPSDGPGDESATQASQPATETSDDAS